MSTVLQAPTLTPAARAILDAASRLFYERGINAVGVDTVVAEAGTTKKTLYDQFGSKAALVVEYLAERDRNYRAWVARELEGKTGVDRVLTMFDALDSWMNAYSPKGCPFVHAHSELLGSADHPAHEVVRAEKRWELELFETLAREARCAAPKELSVQLISLLEGATVLRSISDVPDALIASRRAADVLIRAQMGSSR